MQRKKILDRDIVIPFTKINPLCIINLNMKFKTIKLPEGNIRENLGDLRFGDGFLDSI